MKNRIFAVCLAALALTVGCADDGTVGNPGGGIAGQMMASTDSLNSVDALKAYHSITAYGSVYGDGITERGFVYGTTENPTLENKVVTDAEKSDGKFTGEITGLNEATTYYIRSYAMKSDGNAVYGSQRSTTTETYLYTNITGSIPDLTAITVNANVLNGLPTVNVTERGIWWSTSANPQTTGTKVKAPTAGKGTFSIHLPDMAMVTKFYIVSYAVSSEGTIYSPVHEVSTVTPTPGFFKNILNAAGLMYGVVRNSEGKFVAHFSFNIASDTEPAQSKVNITWIAADGNKDAQHVTRTLNYNADYTQITWDAVDIGGGKSFNGVTRTGTVVSAISGSTLELDYPMPQGDIKGMFVPSKYGGITRTSNITSGNTHGSIPTSFFNDIYVLELKGDDPAGFVTYVWSVNNWCYMSNAKNSDGSPIMPQTEDRITFSFGEFNTGWNGDATQNKASADFIKPFTDIWYDTDGLIILREEKNGPAVFGAEGTGGFYFYAISAKNVGWVKVWLRRYGE